jgi:arsenite methyltransferase
MSTNETIHQTVAEHYATRLTTGSCCAPSASEPVKEGDYVLYESIDLVDVPTEAAQNSFGCGNPTAIAALEVGERVLDLGSGGGLDVFLAARQVGPQGFVYGVDMTDEMLELARNNAAKGGFDNVEFRKGHIEALPLPAQSVDVIISNCVINLSPTKDQTLAEAYRVLAPGGRLAISDIVIDGTLDDLPVREEEVRAALSWAGCIAGALTIEEFQALLAAAGFEKIEITIKHRYSLPELGQDMEEVAATLSPELAAQLVRRFVSANIEARRPA